MALNIKPATVYVWSLVFTPGFYKYIYVPFSVIYILGSQLRESSIDKLTNTLTGAEKLAVTSPVV